MLTLTNKKTGYGYPLFSHPLGRVLKFDHFYNYFQNLPSGGRLLDYGSGDRPYEKMLRTKFDEYIAADYPVTNQGHSKKPDIEIHDDKVDIPSNSIDCIVLTEVIEHIYEPRLVLKELHRVLKPGGQLIGTVPFVMPEHEHPYDYHRYTSFCLEKMFQEAGFRITKLDYIGDSIAVFISAMTRFLGLIPKTLRRLKLGWIALFFSFISKIPEFLYYYAWKSGWNFQKTLYLKNLPLGFGFCLEKKADEAETPLSKV